MNIYANGIKTTGDKNTYRLLLKIEKFIGFSTEQYFYKIIILLALLGLYLWLQSVYNTRVSLQVSNYF